MASPGIFSARASLASSHSCSLTLVRTMATSPMPRGFTCCVVRPEQMARRSERDMKTRLLGWLMSSMVVRTGWSLRYLRDAQMRWEERAVLEEKAEGEGPAVVPRVREEMKPARRRMERMPRDWVVCGRAREACRARKAFCSFEQTSCGSMY